LKRRLELGGTWLQRPKNIPPRKLPFPLIPYSRLTSGLIAIVASPLLDSISPLNDKCKVRSLKKNNFIQPVRTVRISQPDCEAKDSWWTARKVSGFHERVISEKPEATKNLVSA